MRLESVRVTAPGVDLIEIVDARRQCSVDDSDSDDLLTALVGAVTEALEMPRGILRVCLLKQTWRESLSGFPRGAIHLPIEPMIEVTKVEYMAAGSTTWSELAADQWEAYRTDLGGFVQPVAGASWPDTSDRVETVRVTYDAGFGVKVSDVPQAIRHAAKMLVAHYFENREATIVGIQAQELPLGVQYLLQPWFRIPV